MPVFVSPVEDDLISSIEHTDVADMHGFVPNGREGLSYPGG